MKKIAIFLVICVLLTSLMTIGPVAESSDVVAKILNADGSEAGTSYTLTQLKSGDVSVPEGKIFSLLQDVDMDDVALSFNNGANTIVEGNGHQVVSACSYNQDNLAAHAALRLNGNGKIIVKNMTVKGIGANSFGIKYGANVQLVLDNVNMETNYKGIVAYGNNATLEIVSGTYHSGYATICSEGVSDNQIAIKGGYFKSDLERAIIVNNSNAQIDIIGGEFFAHARTTIDVRGNSVTNIYNGYFVNTGTWYPLGDGGQGGASQTINVYGGTFVTSESISMMHTGSANGQINLYGGTYYNYCDSESCKIYSGKGALDVQQATYALLIPTADITDLDSFVTSKRGDDFYILYTASKKGFVKADDPTLRALSPQKDGIRFKCNVSADLIDYANQMKDENTELSFGTVIAPADYLNNLHAFTMEALESEGKAYKNVIATANGLTENEDGSVTIRAGLTSIQECNRDRDFAAVSYVSYQKNGNSVFCYGLYNADQAVSLNDLLS